MTTSNTSADRASAGGALSLRIAKADKLLKMGYLQAAREEYRRAVTDADEPGALLIKIAEIAWSENDFEEAATIFRKAASVSPPTGDAHEMAEVASRSLSEVRLRGPAPTDGSSHVLILLSADGADVAEDGALPINRLLDRPLAYAAKAFQQALVDIGMPCRFVRHPEYVRDARADFGVRCIHVRFAPLAEPRLIKGAYNILFTDWMFDDMPVAQEWPHPFSDRRANLSRFDEIWAATARQAQRLASFSATPVYHVPPPAMLKPDWADADAAAANLADRNAMLISIFARVQSLLNIRTEQEMKKVGQILEGARGRVYLAIITRHEIETQLDALIEGFSDFSRDHEHALLLIHYVHPESDVAVIVDHLIRHHFSRADRLPHALISRSAWLFAGRLADEEVRQLLMQADFYIDCSGIERFDPILAEAIACGCLPIIPEAATPDCRPSPSHPMSLRSRAQVADEGFLRRHDVRQQALQVIDARDVANVLERAHGLHGNHYRAIQHDLAAERDRRRDEARIADRIGQIVSIWDVGGPRLKSPEEVVA